MQSFVLLLQLRDARGEVETRRAAFHCLELLQAGFGEQRSSPKARELVRQMVNERVQLLEGAGLSWCVVGH